MGTEVILIPLGISGGVVVRLPDVLARILEDRRSVPGEHDVHIELSKFPQGFDDCREASRLPVEPAEATVWEYCVSREEDLLLLAIEADASPGVPRCPDHLEWPMLGLDQVPLLDLYKVARARDWRSYRRPCLCLIRLQYTKIGGL